MLAIYSTLAVVTYAHRRGPNKWRDSTYPVEILNDWVRAKDFPEAEWTSDLKSASVTIDGKTYTLDQFGELYALSPLLNIS